MLVLSLDTSSASTTVALGRSADVGVEPLAERGEVAGNRHGELLAPMVAAVLDEAGATPADLGRIVVGVGPGPFTGLRVGMMTAVALGHALGVEVVGVCSLDAVAFAAAELPWDAGFAVLADARRREVYWARYADHRRLTEPAVQRPGEITGLPQTVLGAGALLHRDALPAGVRVLEAPAYPSAATLLRLGCDPDWIVPVRPLYLRRPDATPPGRPKSVTPA